MQTTIKNRTIFCRDNLDILKGINTGSIDLVYLDPPFNKKKQFTAPVGSAAEGASFSDIFRKEDIKDEWLQSIREDNTPLYNLLKFALESEGQTSYNFCYLVYMAIRLIEIQRILKETGSVYLHCDPTMSHYLKLAMDCIFGEYNFRNEIVWGYKWGGTTSKKHFKKKHDIIFRYSKSNVFIFNIDSILIYGEKSGWSDETRGRIPNDWWYDIPSINTQAKERVGYPTQKPLALLERIIKASSNEGDIVLDPFCGCATACVAAERLNRQWVGIDVSVKAYDLVRQGLKQQVERKELQGTDVLFYEELVNFSTEPPVRTDILNRHGEEKYVYVISHPNYPGEYKVGIAKDWKSRLNSYQTSDPDRAFTVEFKKQTPQFREIERYIHEKFDNKHEWVRGELPDIIHAIETFA
ncbi:MAG: DNA methyltransferase [Salinispira sp.]